jgi:gamma-glutamyltranspeptidase / glutathione hydrolase
MSTSGPPDRILMLLCLAGLAVSMSCATPGSVQTDASDASQPAPNDLSRLRRFLGSYDYTYPGPAHGGTLEVRPALSGTHVEWTLDTSGAGRSWQLRMLTTWDPAIQRFRIWRFDTRRLLRPGMNEGTAWFEGDEFVMQWTMPRPDGEPWDFRNRVRMRGADTLVIETEGQRDGGPVQHLVTTTAVRTGDVAPDLDTEATRHVTTEELLGQPPLEPDHRIRFGTDSLHFGDLRLPTGAGPHPVAVLVHGGCWLSFASLQHFDRFAEALTEMGLATWNIAYRKIDHPGAGWPGTFLDVAAGLDHLRELASDFDLDLDRVYLIGHSSGGHLATWAAARHRIPEPSPLRATDPLPVAGVVNIAGPVQIEALQGRDEEVCGTEVIEPLVGGTPGEVPAHYAAASPAQLLPLGVRQLHLVGADDRLIVPFVRSFADQAREAGDDVTLEIVPGAGHHDLIAPWSAAWEAVPEILRRFIQRPGAAEGDAGPPPGNLTAMVSATAGPQAVAAGVRALQAGGTAADAVLTTALANIVLHAGQSVSFTGFMNLVYYEAASGRVHSMNAGYNTVLGEADPLTIPADGPSGRAVLVPGFMAGVQAAHARFGALPFPALFEPAIRFAEDGFALPPQIAWVVSQNHAVLERSGAGRIFQRPDGSWFEAGDTLRQPELAATLRAVAREGAAHMYAGSWARRFVVAVRSAGGRITLDDLAAYDVAWSEPAHGSFRGYDVYSVGAPNVGGLNLVEALNLASAAGIDTLPPFTESAEALFRLLRIADAPLVFGTDLSLRPAAPGLLERHFPRLDTARSARLTPEHARRLWAAMQTEEWSAMLAEDEARREERGVGRHDGHSDAVLAVDEAGNVAALLYTANMLWWGRMGLFVDGVSVTESGDGGVLAGIPPGARLPEATNPAIVLRDGRPVLVSGAISMGVHETTLQSLVSVLAHDATPTNATQTPQFTYPLTRSPGALRVIASYFDLEPLSGAYAHAVGEGSFPRRLVEEVRAMGEPLDLLPDPVAEQNNVWNGIAIDPETGVLRPAIPASQDGLTQGYVGGTSLSMHEERSLPLFNPCKR